MNVSLDQYQKLKQRVDRLQREADKAAGARAERLKRLEDEFGCKSIKEAEKLLAKLEAEAKKVESDYQQAAAEFYEEWGDKLGD